VFDDGTTWSYSQILQNIPQPFYGSTGNDIVETSTINQAYSYTLGTGADTLIFNVLESSDNLGGNGKSEWTDFNLEENDKIDLSKVLINDNGNLQDYISVQDTDEGVIISLDRDGVSQNTYHSEELILLVDNHSSLNDLITSNIFIY
ncbi:type I secretion C-terminal target domain-containing protein, partial [Acinetobacter baumannii]|nr:type I secretion C-terminal target domain-containing protein [Acinetobacter baumannii]